MNVSNKDIGLLMIVMLVMTRTNLNDVYGSGGDSNDRSGIDTSCGNIDNCGDGDRKIDYGDNVDFNIGNDASCCGEKAKLIAVKIQLLKTYSTRSLVTPKLSASLTKLLLNSVAIIMIVKWNSSIFF